ncbi:SAM-dependent methyltransferase [Cryptosporangium japonicum]|uniref:Methyltransferase domain-containing protein n=1 Tax=Cryptosporangium japonicum TaxID=80872 RepID=A0ABN0U9C4_9ACTN
MTTLHAQCDSDTMPFVREFVRDPFGVASVVPSGGALARRVTAPVAASGEPVVVELGPGTGAFTRSIQAALGGRGRHVALEVNTQFTGLLAARFPGVDVVGADARNLVEVLGGLGIKRADVVVSGLPWAAFRPARQTEILGAIAGALRPEGAFTTFAYVHARWSGPARRFRRLLDTRFEEVVVGRTVWANLPPALVYHCRRPR